MWMVGQVSRPARCPGWRTRILHVCGSSRCPRPPGARAVRVHRFVRCSHCVLPTVLHPMHTDALPPLGSPGSPQAGEGRNVLEPCFLLPETGWHPASSSGSCRLSSLSHAGSLQAKPQGAQNHGTAGIQDHQKSGWRSFRVTPPPLCLRADAPRMLLLRASELAFPPRLPRKG